MFYGGKYNENSTQLKTLTLTNFYNEGLVKERVKRLKYRKDIDFYFDSSKTRSLERPKVITSNRIPKTTPYLEIVEGVNLFDLPLDETSNLKKIFKLKFSETKEFQLDKLSYLPYLNELVVQFSNIMFNQNIFNLANISLFPCLEKLDLSFNGLNSDIFLYVKKIKMLRILNLSGNNIDSEICELKGMENLEELNLSHNKIESYHLSNSNSLTKMNTNNLIMPNLDNDIGEINEYLEESNKLEQYQKLVNTNEEQFITRHNFDSTNKALENMENEQEINEEIKQTKEIYDNIQTYMKTNLQAFLHNLSTLPNLKVLDLSNNQIHFFDIDPFHIQRTNGFKNLVKLDISKNLINEELGIILIMNLPSVEMIYFEGNPLLNNKRKFEAIEYEIFRNKNIIFYENGNKNNKHILRNSKIGSIKTTFPFLKPLKINFSDTNKLISKKFKFNQNNQEIDKSGLKKIQEDFIPEYEHINASANKQSNQVIPQRFNKNNNSSFFLTNEPNMNVKMNSNVDNVEENTYQDFLKFARKCLGDDRLYKQSIPITQAYSKLRMIHNNSICDRNDNLNSSKHYLQGTIIGDIRSQQYIPSKDNIRNEFRFLSKFRSLNKSYSLNNSAEIKL